MVSKYTAAYQKAPHDIIYFYIVLQLNILRHFCSTLSPLQENIVQDKIFTFFTGITTPSHGIGHFKIQLKREFKSKHFPFSFLRISVMVRIRIRVRPSTHSQQIYINHQDYLSFHLFYFYVILKYYLNNENGVGVITSILFSSIITLKNIMYYQVSYSGFLKARFL